MSQIGTRRTVCRDSGGKKQERRPKEKQRKPKKKIKQGRKRAAIAAALLTYIKIFGLVISQRIRVASVDPHAKMEMRACGEAGISGIGDHLTGIYILAYANGESGKMIIHRHQSVTMIDKYRISD